MKNYCKNYSQLSSQEKFINLMILEQAKLLRHMAKVLIISFKHRGIIFSSMKR